jgi:hypothetical protein
MVKFGLISCTLMVCVSDRKCIELCDAALFPCYDFQYHYQQREVIDDSTATDVISLLNSEWGDGITLPAIYLPPFIPTTTWHHPPYYLSPTIHPYHHMMSDPCYPSLDRTAPLRP